MGDTETSPDYMVRQIIKMRNKKKIKTLDYDLQLLVLI